MLLFPAHICLNDYMATGHLECEYISFMHEIVNSHEYVKSTLLCRLLDQSVKKKVDVWVADAEKLASIAKTHCHESARFAGLASIVAAKCTTDE